jgi:hypothetical protein
MTKLRVVLDSHLSQAVVFLRGVHVSGMYRGADKSLAQPTSRRILFDGENISFDASLVIYRHYNPSWVSAC